jgi:hypothetical protein
MATKTKERVKVRAREAMVVTVGARPIVWPKIIVRDRHTGKLNEIDHHEAGPIDPGDEGIGYAFKKDEETWSDHPAVVDAPGAFVPVDATRDW